MTKNALALCVALCAYSSYVMALDAMNEEELSALSAQDGITMAIALPTNGWRANEISLTDTNGISASIVAGYANAGTIVAKNVGFNTCSESTIGGSCSSFISPRLPTIKFDMDMIGDNNGGAANGGAMLNIAFSLTGGANKIRFYIDGIYLRNGSAGTTETKLITFEQGYVDVVPIGSSSLLNIHLGDEISTGHLLHFTNGNFGTVDFGTVAILDAVTPANGVRFGFKLENFDITDSGFDINPDGLIYTAANFGGGVMNATFSDIKMGAVGAASIGTIGIEGIKVTNLALTISGKL
jgi:hypothetical protein